MILDQKKTFFYKNYNSWTPFSKIPKNVYFKYLQIMLDSLLEDAVSHSHHTKYTHSVIQSQSPI